MLIELIQLGNIDEHRDGLLLVIREPDYLFIDERFHLAEHAQDLLFAQFLSAAMAGIGSVVNGQEIEGVFLKLVLFNHGRGKGRIGRQGGVPLQNLLTQFFLGIEAKTKLMKEGLETIVFQQLLIIRRVKIHGPQGLMETFDQQSPPFVAFSEIDRAVHCFHAALPQPMPGDIEQHIRGFLAVDAIEKADAAYRNVIPLGAVFFVDKCGDPPDPFPFGVPEDPPDQFPVPESFILLWIKDLFNLFIDRPDIGRVGPVQFYVHLNEFLCQSGVCNFN